MASSLPRELQKRLDDALSSRSQWPVTGLASSAPEIITHISSTSNHNFVIALNDQRFIIKLTANNISALQLNLAIEAKAQFTAWQEGLAPRLVFHDSKRGLLVSEYIESIERHNLQQTIDFESLAYLLTRIHQLPLPDRQIDLMVQGRLYQELALDKASCAEKYINNLADRLQIAVRDAQTLCAKPVFCHNDLLRENRIVTASGILAVDWEYAAAGDPGFELAAIIEGDKLNTQQTALLLKLYEKKSAQKLSTKKLAINRKIYRLIDKLWKLATGNS